MLLDAKLRPGPLSAAADGAAAAAAGFDGVWSLENQRDPFLPLALAAGAAPDLSIGTAIAVAFARTPMTVASVANDLQELSGGRLALGLGSQVRAHVEKRFSMPWSRPAARMREFVLALRAIWACWNERAPLAFRGEFYTHTLMTPNFDPGPNPYGPPAVWLAAVGERMTEVAGEVADGLLAHPFTTERYVRERTIPALGRGAARAGRPVGEVKLSLSAFVAVGAGEEEITAATASVRRQIAFYGSTPAYAPVLDLHGWGGLSPELNRLSKQGRWEEMTGLVDDALLGEMAAVGTPAQVAAQLHGRWGGLLDRITFNLPGQNPPPERFAELAAELRRRIGV
ncbi:MAG: TIGR03617 family F420-dependent LLM class oxidoreductase [Acidimicrobiales bacterium]